MLTFLTRDLVHAVFERFFARHALERFVQHLTLLYDVSATPEQNRLAGVTVPSFEKRPWSIDAGYPIHPQPPLAGPRPYVLPATAAKEHKIRGHSPDSYPGRPFPPYAWSHDERHVGFVVRRRRNESWETKLVVIGIGDDGRPSSRRAIDLMYDRNARFIELGFVDDSIRFARRGLYGKVMIRVVDRD